MSNQTKHVEKAVGEAKGIWASFYEIFGGR